jgi:hypothetical protein
MKLRARLPSLLLAMNWLLLVLTFAWTCKIQQNGLWWLRLDWTSWLSEFRELAHLGILPAGSLWIVWIIATLALTVVWMIYPQTLPDAAPEPSADTARKQLGTDAMMESNPALKEKLLRLHQSLEKI